MTILEKLSAIQQELKVNKGQYNLFGKYSYRSAEDILEAIKIMEGKHKVAFFVTDELKEIGGKVYVESTATILDLEVLDRASSVTAKAQAIIDFEAKGMQMPQRTGAASSYAKKYALGNLLLLDDTKDADATNNHGKAPQNALKPQLKVGTETFKAAKKALAEKSVTMAQVKAKYDVSSVVEKALI